MDKVPFLTVSEFDSVPKYMRGRMTYDSLNAAVSEYNSALEEKYAFLAKGFQAMGSIKDKKRFKEFRSQVNSRSSSKERFPNRLQCFRPDSPNHLKKSC